ncbi:MAG: hypothetical protein ACFFC9_12700 [Promethearchaeota archaeon]
MILFISRTLKSLDMAKIRICPKCKEPKLKQAFNISGWLAPDMYECTACGYIGHIFIELDSDDQIEEESERSNTDH